MSDEWPIEGGCGGGHKAVECTGGCKMHQLHETINKLTKRISTLENRLIKEKQ